MSDINIKAKISLDTAETEKGVSNVKKEVQDVGKEAKKAGSGSFDKLKDSLTSISPAANKASEAAGGFNQVLNVIRANPIIAVVTALVGILIAVGKYMAGVDGAADAMSRSWASLSTLLSAFMDKVLSPLIDGFVWLIDGLTKLGTLIGDTFSPGLKAAADRAGELRDELNDLEDAQKNNAIATAEANLRLAEARDIAMDATKPIKERVKALKEAAKIEKEQADEVYKTNLAIYRNRVEQMGIEMNVRKDLLDTIRNGSIEQLKAARIELLSMKNVNGDKLLELDRYLTEAINSQSASSKIQTKTEKQITAMEKEEESKREAQRKEASDKAKAARDKANEERLQQEKKLQDDLKKVIVEGEKAIQDALKVLRVENRQTELKELNAKYQADLAAAQAAGFSTLKITEAFQKQRDDINKKFDEQDKLKKETDTKASEEKTLATQQKVLGSLTNFVQQSFNIKKDAADKEIEIDRLKLEQQERMVADIGNILGKAGEVFGQQTAVGKAIAIAEATINAFKAGSQVFAAPVPGVAPVSLAVKIATMVAAIANGFKTVKSIIGVKVPSAGAAGGGGSVPALPAPIAPQQASTQLNAASIQGIGNAAGAGVGRAYVTESDISNNEERIRTINRRARLN